jgi:phospholipid/cholesterol/gamma-HCH transport system permease protein
MADATPTGVPTPEIHPPTGVQAPARLGGAWVVASLSERGCWQRLQAELSALVTARTAGWDLSACRIDHAGAKLLWDAWGGRLPAQLQLAAGQKAFFDRLARYRSEPDPKPARDPLRWVAVLGRGLLNLGAHLRDALALLGQVVLDLWQLLTSPRTAPWRDVSGHVATVGGQALGITFLVGLLIGVVLAYLMGEQLKQFGADVFIVKLLGMALIRELGPVLAAILVAGRSGSAITAQIGVMRVTEELDAMRVMGISHGYRLVLPRVLAMAVAVPLLVVWTSVAALLGGIAASALALGLSPAYFVESLTDAVPIGNLYLALSKGCVFGMLIALIGCHYGFQVKPNTQSLGRNTTAAVVAAITGVIAVDAVFAIVFKDYAL